MPDGIVFLVHGRAGSLDSMWVFARPSENTGDLVFVAPQAPLVDTLGGYSWWEVEDGSRGGVAQREELDLACQKLSVFVDNFTELFSRQGILSPDLPKLAVGFSQGSGVLSSLAFKRPSLFEGVALLAGFVPSVEQEVEPEGRFDSESGPEIFMASGMKDQIIKIDQSRKSAAYLRATGLGVTYREDEVGHKVSSAGIKDLNAWIGSKF